METVNQDLWSVTEIVIRGKETAINAYIRKEERSKTNPQI